MRARESEVTELKVNSLPDYQWPRFIQQMSCVELCLSPGQREAFNRHFSMLFHHAGATHHNHHMKSSVVREAINVLRMMSVIAFFRALEDDKGFSVPAMLTYCCTAFATMGDSPRRHAASTSSPSPAT